MGPQSVCGRLYLQKSCLMNVEIYINGGGQYYGTLRMAAIRPPFTVTEEKLTEEILRRLPLLKGKEFIIRL